MNYQQKSMKGIIAFIFFESGIIVTAIMSIRDWRDCFIWGHFCTHNPIEFLLKLYCGVTGPLAIIILLTYRYFLRLSLNKQLVFAALSFGGLLANALLYYQIYIY